jgi:hypothetical protein
LDDLVRDTTIEIGGTQLGGPARRDPADAGAAARDDGGLPRLGTACRRGVGGGSVSGGGGAVDQSGTHPVWIDYSRGRDRRGGGVPSGSATPQVATGGGRLVGLRCSLSDTAPEPAAVGRDHHPRYPLTCPTHHIRAAQRAAAAAKRKEHQGPPRLMKRDRI